MSIEQLAETAQAMVAAGKGIIAIDESNNTIAKRFDGVGIPNSEENRRAYREMLLTTPGLSEHISGAILYDETIRQSTKAGVPFSKIMRDNGIIPASRSTRARSRSPDSRVRSSPKASTACATASRSTTASARVSPSGAR